MSFFRGKLRAFEIPLASLAPGQYTCQVNVVDEFAKKFAFRRAPTVLLP